MINKILVPLDGSAHSKKALEFACELAKKFDSQLHLLHVVQPPISTQTIGIGASAIRTNFFQKDLDEIGRNLIEAAKQIAIDHDCNNVETQIEAGLPAHQIIDNARKHDVNMIIMGSRGLTDLTGLLQGSVSHKVTHLAECSCLTIR